MYEAELAGLRGAQPVYDPNGAASGAGAVALGEERLGDVLGLLPRRRGGDAPGRHPRRRERLRLSVNGGEGTSCRLAKGSGSVAVSLSGGVNKVTVTGQ